MNRYVKDSKDGGLFSNGIISYKNIYDSIAGISDFKYSENSLNVSEDNPFLDGGI